jgi:hypothetical protein
VREASIKLTDGRLTDFERILPVGRLKKKFWRINPIDRLQEHPEKTDRLVQRRRRGNSLSRILLY